jgi:hypothetical protein
VKAGGLSESAEVAVTGDEGNAGVDAALGYESVAEAGSLVLRDDFCV